MKKLAFYLVLLTLNVKSFAQYDLSIVVEPVTRTICVNDTIIVELDNVSGGQPQNYSWDFGEGATPPTGTGWDKFKITYSTPGTKTIKVVYFGTTQEASTTITVSQLEKADLIPNVKFNPSARHILSLHADIKPTTKSVGTFTYEWTVTDAVSNKTIETVKKQTHECQVPGDGHYAVKLYVEDNAGCNIEWNDTLTTEFIFKAPNIFTPNDDGQNDVFIVESDGVQKLKIEIYDRWGAVVFRPDEYLTQIVWDGKNTSGMKVKPGVYFYVIEVEDDKTLPLKGFVHVHY